MFVSGDLQEGSKGHQDTLFRPQPSQPVFADSAVIPPSREPEPPSSSWTATYTRDHTTPHSMILPSPTLALISGSDTASKPVLLASSQTFDLTTSWSEDNLSQELIMASSTLMAFMTFRSSNVVSLDSDHLTITIAPSSLGNTISFTEQILPTTTTGRGDYTPSRPPLSLSPRLPYQSVLASQTSGDLMTPSLDGSLAFTAPASDMEVLPGVTSHTHSEQATPTTTRISMFNSMQMDSMAPSPVHSPPTHSHDVDSIASDIAATATEQQSLEPTLTLVPDLPSTWSLVPDSTAITNSFPEASQTILDGSTPVPSGSPTPPGGRTRGLNYMLIVYVVPPIGVVLLCVVMITVFLCCKRYRR